MARFDVYRTSYGTVLLDCQTDFLTRVETRLVAPLRLRAQIRQPIRRLMPIFNIDGVEYVMITPLLAAVPRNDVGKRIGSLADQHDEIMGAIDLLLTGI